MSFDSAFWVFNMVSNFAYSRWDELAVEIRAEIRRAESELFAQAAAIEKSAAEMYQTDAAAAIKSITGFTASSAQASPRTPRPHPHPATY